MHVRETLACGVADTIKIPWMQQQLATSEDDTVRPERIELVNDRFEIFKSHRRYGVSLFRHRALKAALRTAIGEQDISEEKAWLVFYNVRDIVCEAANEG